MVDVIDDFDSVMTQVMKELEGEEKQVAGHADSEEAPAAPEMFNEVVEYSVKEKISNNDIQFEADNLIEEKSKKERSESIRAIGLGIEKVQKAEKPAVKSGSGSFSIDLEGIIGVDLKLKFGEKELFITCDDEQLIIRLADGSTFNIPFKGKIEKVA